MRSKTAKTVQPDGKPESYNATCSLQLMQHNVANLLGPTSDTMMASNLEIASNLLEMAANLK